MPRSALARMLALVIALIASLATPGLAFAHGYAHSELAEHATSTAHHASGMAVSPVDPEPAHQHAAAATGTARWSAPSPAIQAVAEPLSFKIDIEADKRTFEPRSQPPLHSADLPPSPSRAPPA